MMTSSNGNIFRLTGHLCREFTSHRWIPHTKASDEGLWCFLWSALDPQYISQYLIFFGNIKGQQCVSNMITINAILWFCVWENFVNHRTDGKYPLTLYQSAANITATFLDEWRGSWQFHYCIYYLLLKIDQLGINVDNALSRVDAHIYKVSFNGTMYALLRQQIIITDLLTNFVMITM